MFGSYPRTRPALRVLLVRAVLVLLGLAAPAGAQDQRFPPLPLSERRGYELSSWVTLRPYLRTGAAFSNNVLQESNSQRDSDTVYYAIPGLDVHLGTKDTWVEVGYAPSFLVYHHLGGLDTVEHRLRYVGEATSGALRANSSGTATWAAYNTDPQFTGRVRNFQGAFNLDLEYAIDPVWGVKSTSFANESINFPEELHDTNTAEWGASVLGTASPNVGQEVTLLVGASFREIHYVDRKATNPDLSIAGALGGVQYAAAEWLRADLLAGVELPWVKKHNGLSRADDDLHPEPIVNLTAAVLPIRGTELLLAVRHRLEASASADFQRSTTMSGTLSWELPFDVTARLVGTLTLQDPRRSSELRLQAYQAILIWEAWEHLELGGQAGYTRSSVKGGGYESVHAAATLTLKL